GRGDKEARCPFATRSAPGGASPCPLAAARAPAPIRPRPTARARQEPGHEPAPRPAHDRPRAAGTGGGLRPDQPPGPARRAHGPGRLRAAPGPHDRRADLRADPRPGRDHTRVGRQPPLRPPRRDRRHQARRRGPTPAGRRAVVATPRLEARRGGGDAAGADAYAPSPRDAPPGAPTGGTPRLATLAATLCRAPTDLDRAIVRCFAIQAVARVLDPGCKADCCFVLFGDQGTLKSSALKALAGEFFSDGDLPDNARDQGQLLRTSWIHELGEIDRYLAARSQATVKATLSRGADGYRPPYGRHPIRVARTYVLTGTTNQRRFLTHPTGNRPYWTVEAPAEIDTAWIVAHRDQLWAEAAA